MNQICNIILENTLTFKERHEISELTENQVSKFNNVMISNLYKSAIEKSHINFGDIPKSKGNITDYSGYKTMIETLSTFNEIFNQNKNELVVTIQTAINNLITYREHFEKGFKLNKEFIILLYNSIVYSCVESISIILSSFIDFIVHPDVVEFKIDNQTNKAGWLCIDNLRKFNESINKGDFQKTMKLIISSGKENFSGGAISLIVIGSLLSIVPLIREMVFYFYYSRMKLSDFLEQQATFLEVHKENMLNDRSYYLNKKPLSNSDKKKIQEKQIKRIKLLRDFSKKIQVNNIKAEKETENNLKDQNKHWTFKEVKNQTIKNDSGGYQLL